MKWLSYYRTLVTGLICLASALFFGGGYWGENRLADRGVPPLLLLRTENYLKDLFQRGGRRVPVDASLVYLGIGDSSMTLGGVSEEEIAASPALRLMQADWPWDRTVYQLILDRLIEAGAKVVVIDLLFPTPKSGDEQFSAALARHRDQVLIGSNFVKGTLGTAGVTTTLSLPAGTLIPPSSLPDRRIGYVNYFTDADGVLRRTRCQVTMEDFGTPANGEETQVYDSLVAATLRKIGRPDLIPELNPVAIRFAGPAGTFSPRPVFELFVPTLWKANFQEGAFFKDKIVIVGPDGNFHQDLHSTPLDEAMPGPEIQLSVLNAALHRDFLRETPISVDLVIVGLAALVSWLTGTAIRQAKLRLLILAALAVAYLGALRFLYDERGLLTVSATPLLVLASSGLGCLFYDIIYDLIRERLEKRKVRAALERYVSRDAVREILDNAESFLNTLGGQRRNITVLFSDIRGFTQLTESADPQVLVAQLTEYFNDMVGLVFAHHGTLDKFIGDAVMAHWGGIVTAGAEADARRAVTTAMEMRAALVRLNASWKSRGLPKLAIGIGVNHGAAIVGSIGCEAKMEISAIGDAINLGSRIEGVTKEYGLDLCLGESVVPFVREAFILRSVDLIVVKGKTKPVEVFTVLGERAIDMPEPAWLARHEAAVRAYRAGDFAAAEAAWLEVLAAEPGDPLALIFFARCATLRENPPLGAWAGVFTMPGK